MIQKKVFTSLSILVLIVFIASLFSTANVRADEGTPPPPTEEPTEPPTEDTDTGTVPTETEVAPAETEPAPTETPASEEMTTEDPTETPELDTVEEILDAAPEGVDVVVLDENGDALPLVTEEAASIIMQGDPQWCPEGQTPGTDLDDAIKDCTDWYPDLPSLLVELTTNTTGSYGGNGTIYISYDYGDFNVNEGLITIDHNSNDLANLDDLTIQGGWDFSTDTFYLNDSTYQSTLDGTWLRIENWQGNVNVNNIFINNASDIDASVFTDIGLFVYSESDINLNEVTVENSDLDGAVLNSEGNVEVTNSEFNNNGYVGYESDPDPNFYQYDAGHGLSVYAEGNVTLYGVFAVDNAGHGAYISSGVNVLVTESDFVGNGYGAEFGAHIEIESHDNYADVLWDQYAEGYDGLFVQDSQSITLFEVYASENAGNGALLFSDGNVSIESSEFDSNGEIGSFSVKYELLGDDPNDYSVDFALKSHAGNGLYVETDGGITLLGVFAFANNNAGMLLYADGDIDLTNTIAIYNGWGTGFFDTDSGDLLADNLDNVCDYLDDVVDVSYEPLYFDPCADPGAMQVVAPNFEYYVESFADDDGFQNSYRIYQDGGLGLDAESLSGEINVNNLGAIFNTGNGVQLEADGNISLTEADMVFNGGYNAFYGVFEGPPIGMAEFYMGECVARGGYTCEYNGYDDGFNSVDEFAGSGLLSIGGFLEIDYGNGLDIESETGDISLSLVDVIINGDDGAKIEAENGKVFIEESAFSQNGLILNVGDYLSEMMGLDVPDLNMTELYIEFSASAAEVYSFDPIGSETLEDLLYSATHLENGDDFYNLDELFYSDIFDSPDEYLYWQVYSDFTSGEGVEVEASGDITLDVVIVEENRGTGADLESGGNITISESEFINNGYGVYGGTFFAYFDDINYLFYPLSAGFVISEWYDDGGDEFYYLAGEFNTYNGVGLYAGSYGGNLTLTDVIVDNNLGFGASVNAFGNVSVTGASFSGNGYGAYQDVLFGFIYDDVEGIDLEEEITVDTNGNGLNAFTVSGYISLADIVANNNSLNGAELGSFGSGIFVSGAFFEGNGEGSYNSEFYAYESGEPLYEFHEYFNGDGLLAQTVGDISLSSVFANNNALYGAELFSAAIDSVFVENSQFNNNGFTGKQEYYEAVYESGPVIIYEDLFTAVGSGLYVRTDGNVTLSYVDASSNYLDGAEIYSNGGYVHVYCGTYNNNGEYGIYEDSLDTPGYYFDGASQLGLFGPEMIGNGTDSFYFSHSVFYSTDCPIPEEAALTAACFDELPHLLLVLNDENEPNGDFVIFPCPLNGTPSVIETHEENLPGPLPDFKPDEEGGEAIYRSALHTELDREGELVSQNEKLILVSFLIPDGVDVESLTILRWTGEEWVELGGVLSDVGPDGLVEEGKLYLKTSTFDLGFFALVSK